MNQLNKNLFTGILLLISLSTFALPEFRLKSCTDIERLCKIDIISIDSSDTPEIYKIGSCYKVENNILTREEFVKDIEDGKYPRYDIYERNGVKYLRSKPNETREDNLIQ